MTDALLQPCLALLQSCPALYSLVQLSFSLVQLSTVLSSSPSALFNSPAALSSSPTALSSSLPPCPVFYILAQLSCSLVQLSTTLSCYLAALCNYSTAVSNPPCATDSLLPPLHSWSCAGRHSCTVAISTTWMFHPGGTSSFHTLDWNSWSHFFNSESLKWDTFEVFPLSFAIISISISGMAATCIIDFNAFWQQANDFVQHICSPVKKKKRFPILFTLAFFCQASTQSESLLLINMLPKIRHSCSDAYLLWHDRPFPRVKVVH